MGLKKTNYEIKSLGITLPEAYAIVKNLVINGESARADFAVQASRESASNLKPLEVKTLHFKVDRNTNPYVTAYLESKKPKIVDGVWNEQSKTYETAVQAGIFTGWEDDLGN